MSAPVTVTCSECGARLKLKSRERLGKRRPCPKCATPFVLTEDAGPAKSSSPSTDANRPLLIGLAAGGLVAVGMIITWFLLLEGGDSVPQSEETVADGSNSTLGTSPTSTGGVPHRADSGSARQNGFDLLAMANVQRDAQGGDWTRDGSAIVSQGGTAILQLPIEPAGDYRADVTFTRESDDQQVNLILAVPGTDRKFLLVLDWKGGGHHGIETVNGASPGSGNPTHNDTVPMRPAGEANRASVEVRATDEMVSIKAELNGQLLFDLKGQPRQLDSAYWQTKNPKALGPGSGSGGSNRFVVRYDEYRLTPLGDWASTPTEAIVVGDPTARPRTDPEIRKPASTNPGSRPGTSPSTPVSSKTPGATPGTQLETRPVSTPAVPVAISIEPDSQTFIEVVRPFLQQNCVRCHGLRTQESDFRVDEDLPNIFGTPQIVARWSEVLNMLNSGDIPPEGEPRAPAAMVARVAEWIEHEVGQGDRRKLDEYLNSVRETERRVQRLENWVDRARPSVSSEGLNLTAQPHNDHDFGMWFDVLLEISYRAFQTDTTRVITFQFGREAGGGPSGNHHELSHHGGNAKSLAGLAEVDRFYIGKLAHFLKLLKSTGEADGSMLDRTMVLYGSGMSNGKGGGHSGKDLPMLLAGGSGLGLKHGQHLKHEVGKVPLSNVLLTMLQKMGVNAGSFGDSTATLTGLT